MKKAMAGSVESNDALITVSEHSGREIEISSIVGTFFYNQIKKVIVDTLDELDIQDIKVECVDKGALDYTIKARLITAIERMNK